MAVCGSIELHGIALTMIDASICRPNILLSKHNSQTISLRYPARQSRGIIRYVFEYWLGRRAQLPFLFVKNLNASKSFHIDLLNLNKTVKMNLVQAMWIWALETRALVLRHSYRAKLSLQSWRASRIFCTKWISPSTFIQCNYESLHVVERIWEAAQHLYWACNVFLLESVKCLRIDEVRETATTRWVYVLQFTEKGWPCCDQIAESRTFATGLHPLIFCQNCDAAVGQAICWTLILTGYVTFHFEPISVRKWKRLNLGILARPVRESSDLMLSQSQALFCMTKQMKYKSSV